MTSVKTFARRLASGERLLATSASLSPPVAEMMGHCGFDWLFIDAEYLPLSSPDIQALVCAADNTGTPAVVRLNNDSDALIRQVLDMDAALLRSAAAARLAEVSTW